MTAAAWQRFVAYAKRARTKPSFDEEERTYKFAVVDGLESVLEAIQSSQSDWFQQLVQVLRDPFVEVGGHRYDLPNWPQIHWMREWNHADAESLRAAVAPFAERDLEPRERFGLFARQAEEAMDAGTAASNTGAPLAMGGLLNFASAPYELPLIRAWPFEYLEQILGRPTGTGASLAGQYERHLGFGRWLLVELPHAGVSVRDLIDVQSIVFICAAERRFWVEDKPSSARAPSTERRSAEPSRGSRGPEPPAYLSITAMFRDEAPYLREWIEFHRLVGVERFFLYDNMSVDAHAEVLAPYIADGTVVVHEWPFFPGQQEAYGHTLAEHGHESRWIAFIDVDEFLFSPTRRSVADLLGHYERWPAVGVNWAMFGTSGHHDRPRGLVIESYHRRAPDDALSNRYIKSIIDPRRVASTGNAHYFIYDRYTTVDENEYPVQGPLTKSVSFDLLRLNHYFTRSEREAREKLKGRGDIWDSLSEARRQEVEHGRFSRIGDEAIKSYLPALRASLERAAERDEQGH